MQAAVISNRKFGHQLGLGLIVVSLIGVWRGWASWLVTGLAVVALIHLVLARVAPTMLAPFNRVWMSFGQLLGRVVSPIVLTLMFAGLFVPIAVVMRVFGRDELLLRDRSGDSFWIPRAEASITAESFRNQY